jgi:ATP-dependent protease Clp ATPase subunit
MRRFTETSLRCSFCHKSEKAGIKLISSPSDYPRAYICDECVAVCASIVADDSLGATEPSEIDEATHPLLPHPLASRLLRALELWIKRESLGEDAAEELAEVRSVASRIFRE